MIEVYKGRYPAERNIGIYALYVMFFPQLVAGPIERPQQLLPQLHALGDFDESRIVDGLRIMLWGFFKKVVVADTIGSIVDPIYKNLHTASGASLALAMVAFAFQLYADFSGYSDIARGSAKVFGVELDQQLPSSLLLPLDRRFLAALAYLALELVPGLFLPAARTFLGAHFQNRPLFRPHFHFPHYRPLARRIMDIGLLRRPLWIYMAIGQLTRSLRMKMAASIGLPNHPRLDAFLET